MFEQNESFKHRLAKKLLLTWLNDKFLRVVEEESFSTKGFLRFVVDLACYNENGLCEIYEIVHTNEGWCGLISTNFNLKTKWKQKILELETL